MKRFAALVVLSYLLFSSCSDPSWTLTVREDRIFADTTVLALRNWGTDGKYIRAFSLETAFLDFFDAKTGQLDVSVPLQGIDSLSSERRMWGITSNGPDSVFVLIPRSRMVCLVNRNGKLIRQWELKGTLAGGISDYALVNVPRSGMLVKGHLLYATSARTTIPVNTKKDRRDYFRTPGEVIFDFSKPELPVRNTTGLWPLNYRNGNGYRDYYPQRCINSKGQVVHGFGADDSVFVYENGKRIASHLVTSAHMTTRHEYPDDSIGNYAYVDQYMVEEPRYLSLDYDPYRKLYYRIVHHAQQYVSSDSITLNQTIDKSWSLLILDEAFQVKGEVVFDPQVYLPAVLITTDGVLVMRRNESLTLPRATFTLFQPESE